MAQLAQLTDSHNRKMDYLRISVTDRCNFRCQYCMPEDIKFQDKSHILTLEEMLTFAEACLMLGVTKVRVTGGEPLVRRGVVKFVGWLKDLGFEDVTMTTNGYLLEENLDGLVEAGLDRINISLDTLRPEKFAFITRRNHFQKVWSSIMAALETPLSPVKINAVAMRGVNDDEIVDMAKLTLKYPMHVRFIELMPLNGDTDGSRFRSLFIPGREILERAQDELGDLREVEMARATGFIGAVAGLIGGASGSLGGTAVLVLWGSGFASGVVDNIPFTATMIPVIEQIGAARGYDAATLETLWWSLSLGACLGGNFTLIGASANLVVAGLADRSGVAFTFWRFLLAGAPLTLVALAISTVYVLLFQV